MTSNGFFFFNDTATTEIYTLSLHDALPILVSPASCISSARRVGSGSLIAVARSTVRARSTWPRRSEEHTSELQSQSNLVCRLLLEKKKKQLEHIPSTGRLSASYDLLPLPDE